MPNRILPTSSVPSSDIRLVPLKILQAVDQSRNPHLNNRLPATHLMHVEKRSISLFSQTMLHGDVNPCVRGVLLYMLKGDDPNNPREIMYDMPLDIYNSLTKAAA